MKSLIPVLLLLVTACGQTTSIMVDPPNPYNQDALPVALAATVVLATAYGAKAFCSGVVSDHLVYTAAHCVEDAPPFRVHFFNGVQGYWRNGHDVKVVHRDDVQDLAILRFTSHDPGFGLLMAEVGPQWGNRVVVIGHPVGLEYTVTEGIVSHPSRHTADHHWLQVSAPVFFGNSGGPVLNAYGEVVGIVSFFVGTPHLVGAVHLDEIKKARFALQKEE